MTNFWSRKRVLVTGGSYVDDAAEGVVLAVERYDEAEPVNLAEAATL